MASYYLSSSRSRSTPLWVGDFGPFPTVAAALAARQGDNPLWTRDVSDTDLMLRGLSHVRDIRPDGSLGPWQVIPA